MAADRMHTFSDMLTEMAREWADTPNQRWLRQNAAAIERAHREMLDERQSDEPKSL